jgi:hypothetical protein
MPAFALNIKSCAQLRAAARNFQQSCYVMTAALAPAVSCEPRISEAMPCFARAVLTVNEQFFEGVDMAGESDGHVCRIISGS